MTYQIEVTETAEREAGQVFEWLLARTPQHAPRWLDGLVDAYRSLSEMPHRCARAPESAEVNEDVRQLLYGKRAGVYRILFVVREQTVYILHVRHGARETLKKGELELPADPS